MAREERSSLALVEDKEVHARMHTRACARALTGHRRLRLCLG